MKKSFIILSLLMLQILAFGQEQYTSTKGSRYFARHLHMVITVDSNVLRYELFNHWYNWRYRELRNIYIPIDSLDYFNINNDSINIIICKNKIKLIDKKYGLKRSIKHGRRCASPPFMRKTSFAENILIENDSIHLYDLYKREDLKLNEAEFELKVIENLNKKIK